MMGKRNLWILTAILLLGAILRIPLISSQGFWFDELFGVYFARMPLAELYRGIALEGTKMPLFYTLIHSILPPNNVELVLRLLTAAFGLLSIAVIYRLTKRMIPHKPQIALWTALLLAINAFHMHYSREARPYSLMLLLAVVAMWAFVALLTRGSGRWWLVLLVSHALLFITNLFGLLIPFVQFIHLATSLRRYPNKLLPWMLVNGVALVPLVAWYVFMYQTNSGQLRFAASWFPISTAADLLYTFWNFTLGYLPQLDVVFALGLLLIGALALIGLLWVLRNRISLPLIWLSPLLVVWLVGTRRPVYGDRYLIILLPGLVILIAAGIASLRQAMFQRVISLAVIAIMLIGCWQIPFNPENRREEWRAAATVIRLEHKTGEAIYTTELNAAISLSFYDPGDLPLRVLDSATTITESGFWLVIGYAEFSPHRLGQPYLMDWTANRTKIETDYHVPANAVLLRVDVLAGVVVAEYGVPSIP
ncbi:MAG: glycosyltransferase family 39 protein [Anaerolineae bacterium]|nr:glycosyltransferase family 39 protein [Anaerolineae bacterium]